MASTRVISIQRTKLRLFLLSSWNLAPFFSSRSSFLYILAPQPCRCSCASLLNPRSNARSLTLFPFKQPIPQDPFLHPSPTTLVCYLLGNPLIIW
ncbi:hypothetical protein Ahy_B05g078683 isoform A [Arachis hypogaea]|uniref:Uncharacterized protein n=1 Tax=Arachis hypogaea TaxID=3818 RepID=A0A444Z7Q5_ARAHY|nr:hypothetical protein Ahy_B05g078683 isoform A [Arachis hypogaea]